MVEIEAKETETIEERSIEDLERENAALKENLELRKAAQLDGQANAPKEEPEPEKEETPSEYKDRVLAGGLND